mmetsp:Transcript_31510/g.36227  ORF Transcript_31510/g.36227 Transcript_31510/m.36227 type:complete len:309 (+) Transcript_31510:105-1031(+)
MKTVKKSFLLHILICKVANSSLIDAFIVTPQRTQSKSRESKTAIFGALNRRNKQADLIKKMQEAKKQREVTGSDGTDDTTSLTDAPSTQTRRKSDDEIKRENDLKRFDQLLNSEAATLDYGLDGNSNNYMTKQQEEEEIDAGFRGLSRIFEGDPAKEEPFQDLLRIENGNALGEAGTKRLLPWLNKNPSKENDYLVVVTDPRPKSDELRSAMNKFLKLSPDVLSRMIVINADTPAENRRYLKKQGITTINILCDEKREWMREYTALGEKRWAMCMFILQDTRVQKLVREVDVELASHVVQSAVKTMER